MNWQVNDNKVLRDFAPKVEKEEVFHTSGYATAQSGTTIGSGASGIDLAKRQAIESQRKFIRGYNNSRIMSGLYGVRRAITTTPRTAGGTGAVSGTTGVASGTAGETASIARTTGLRGMVSSDARTTGIRGSSPVPPSGLRPQAPLRRVR